ncbi:adenosine receptor A1-like [Oculina patagonica]
MANVSDSDGNYTGYEGELLPTGLAIFFVALNIFLSITASLGNALILISLHKVSSIHPPTKLLFRCLAVTDFCVGLISQPLYAIQVMLFITNINTNLLYYVVPVNFASSLVLCGVSILTSTAISIDRLLALWLGLRYKQTVTLRRVGTVVICFWLLSCALGGWSYSSWKVNINITVLIVLIILSLLTSVFSYTKIYFRLRDHQNQLQQQLHVNQGQPKNGGEIALNIARYKRVVSSIAWVQLALITCYLPFSVYSMLTMHGWMFLKDPLIADLFVFSCLYLNSSMNPILYSWKIREVRQAVKNTVKLNCCTST